MERFFVTIILGIALSFFALFSIITKTDPYQGAGNRLLFLVCLLFFLTLVNSLILYIFLRIKSPKNVEAKFLYRKSLKTSFIISLLITGIATLKAFGALNFINVLLLGSLIFLIAKIRQR